MLDWMEAEGAFPPAKRHYLAVSGSLLAIIGATYLGLILLARNQRLAEWIGAWDRRRCERTNNVYYHRLNFEAFDIRLLLDEFPKADHSRGGAYFFGASALKVSVKTWELPPEQRELIRNYGIGGSNNTHRFQLVRYLVDYEGLLQAGGEKTHVIMGALFTSARDFARDFGDLALFPNLFRMFGLYTYSNEDGIRPVAMSRIGRSLRVERIRCSQFLRSNLERLHESLCPEKPYEKDLRQEAAFWQIRMGPNWQAEMAVEVAAFAQQIEYLLDHNVGVTVVYMPLPSVHRESVYHLAYHEQIAAICKSTSVPLVDLADLLADDEFSDAMHPNHRGLKKVHPILVGIALDRLREMGTLPPAIVAAQM